MSGLWPAKTRCVVMLTFDIDWVSGILRRDPEMAKHPSVMSLGDFGPNVGVPRILDLLDEYRIKASFFVPGYSAEHFPDVIRDIARRGHELGNHGYMHEPPSSLGPDEDEGEILDRGTRILEELTGQRPWGYRAPSGELSERSLSLLVERGFVYDSSLMGNDVPYLLDTPEGRIVELPLHWSLDDWPYYVYLPVMNLLGPMASPLEVFNAWQWEFDGAYKYGRAFMLTMHPFISGRLAKITALERLIRYIRSHTGVEFMRCIDVAQEWAARRQI